MPASRAAGARSRWLISLLDISNNYCGAGILPAIDMIFTRFLLYQGTIRDRGSRRFPETGFD